MKLRTYVCILVALIAVRFLIAAVTPVFDTSEARYAALSANMARSGDFVVPRYTYNDTYQSFDGKPPLLFQTGGLVARAFGVSEFAVRLPVLVFSVLLVLFVGWGVCRVARAGGDACSTERGVLAAGMTATAVAWYALAGFCMADGMLVACVGAAYMGHALYLATGNRNWTWTVFAALGIGMIVKGPVALVLFGFPVFIDTCVNRRWRAIGRYRWFTGVALFLLLAVPWFVLVERANPGSVRYFFVNENFLRFVTHDYGDKYGNGREYFRGVAALWLVVVTLPWFPWVAWKAWKARRSRSDRPTKPSAAASSRPPYRVFLWGVAGITVFWCLTSRVPIGYVIPAVPLFMCAFALAASDATVRQTLRALPALSVAAVLVLSGALGAMRLSSDKMDGAASAYRTNRYSHEFYHGTPGWAIKEAK